MKVYAINRKQDSGRLQSVLKTCERDPSLDVTVIEAIDGSFLDFELPVNISPNSFIRKTPKTVACFMSHASCWEAIANSSDEFALILEDDSLVEPKFADVENELLNIEFDICFVNVRAREYLRLSGLGDERPYQTVDDVVCKLVAGSTQDFEDKARGGKLPPPGGDGYVISKSGAQKALQFGARDGYPHHVDHWLFFRSMSDETALRAATKKSIEELLSVTDRHGDRLKGLIRSEALVWTDRNAPSVRI